MLLRITTLALLAYFWGCASVRPQKMSWPVAKRTPRPAPASIAKGGPIRAPAPKPPVVIHHDVEDDLPPEVPRDGRRYLFLQWPLPATGVNSLYGWRTDPVDGTARYHGGVDLEADYGAVLNAAADGVVVAAGWHKGHGRRVVIHHVAGYETSYSHLSQILVQVGIRVAAKEPIGRAGNSGRSTGPHLHFEVNRWGAHLDPLDFLGIPVPID